MVKENELFSTGKYLTSKEEKHFRTCVGCLFCDNIMELYGHCSGCDIVLRKTYLNYRNSTGEYYCEECDNHIFL